MNCDVLVIGAGPAGLSVARAARLNNKSVICIDKKSEIGEDIRCAEGIAAYLLPALPFSIPKKYLDLEMDGMIFYSEGVSLNLKDGFWKSFSLNRAGFEKWLSNEVMSNGGQVLTSTELVKINKSKSKINSVIVNNNGKYIEIFPKYVVAADGVESKTLTLLGVYKLKKGQYADVYSWELHGVELIDDNKEQIFFGEFTPKGYAYIFPKGKGVANVGVGGIAPTKPIEKYFYEFLDLPIVKKQVSSAKFVKNKSKKAPFFYVTKKRVFGNVYSVGDSANDNFKPFVEGILPAIIMGDYLGKNIGKKIKSNPLSKQFEESDALLKLVKKIYSFKDQKKSGLILMLSIAGIIPLDEATKFYKTHSVDELKELVKGQ